MIRKYGLTWPDELHPAMIELKCWKHWKLPPYNQAKLLEPEQHFLNATRLLFRPDQYTPDPWSLRMIRAWSRYDTVVMWGAASCGKSHTTGLLCLLDYLAGIDETVTLLCSTSKIMLAMRSFASVKYYFDVLRKHPEFTLPVKETKSLMAICHNDTDDSEEAVSMKASVRGVAVAQGTEEEARGKLQGAHLPFVRLVLDESEAMRDAAFSVRSNMSLGAEKGFKFILLCNPESYLSKTAYFAEPVDGWSSVDVLNADQWETKVGGICLHFDGFKSPAITEPDGPRRFPYLITQPQIDRIVAEAHGNLDAPEIYQMVRGVPPPTGLERALVTEQELTAFDALGKPVWANRGEIVRLAALDPAFTSDGDSCVLQVATIGRDSMGHAVLALEEPRYVPILASSPRPVTYQISDAVRQELASLQIPVSSLAVDDSGTQSVADVLDVEIGPGCTRYNYGTKPSDKAISAVNPTPASDRCKNLATEMYMVAAEFVRSRQLKGLGEKAARHWTGRRFRKGLAAGRQLETKSDFKKRTGMRSPDEGDAAAMVCMLARDNFGFLPGGAPSAVKETSGVYVHQTRPILTLRTKYLATEHPFRVQSYLKPK